MTQDKQHLKPRWAGSQPPHLPVWSPTTEENQSPPNVHLRGAAFRRGRVTRLPSAYARTLAILRIWVPEVPQSPLFAFLCNSKITL